MTDTNQLPPLPMAVAHITVGDDTEDVFTADQMRDYALQSRAQLAQGEPVSDEQRSSISLACEMLDAYIECIKASGEYDRWHYIPQVEVARDDLLAMRPAAQEVDEREANATARAFSLATMAAEEFVRCNGLSTGEPDEFLMTGADLTDEYATGCIEHLKHVGECVAFDCDDGVIVRLGDFTLGSLS